MMRISMMSVRMTIVPAGSKATRLSSVNHTKKSIHHHHYYHNLKGGLYACSNKQNVNIILYEPKKDSGTMQET